MSILTKMQELLQLKARDLAQSVIKDRAAEVDRSEAYPWNNIEALTQAGFMGMTIPEEFGGQGLGYMDTVLVIEEMAKVCGVTGRIVVEANMGGVGAIMAYGTEKQKRLAADLVLSGDKPAICITEPGAGSAATEMTTTAVKKGGHYILNGTKHWITGGGVSKLHLIFCPRSWKMVNHRVLLVSSRYVAPRDYPLVNGNPPWVCAVYPKQKLSCRICKYLKIWRLFQQLD